MRSPGRTNAGDGRAIRSQLACTPLPGFAGALMKTRIMMIAVLACVVTVASASGQGTCEPDKACCVLPCSGNTELPTAEECLADACACGQRLHCYATERAESWALYPGTAELQPTDRPVHGRYLTIRANPTAIAGLESFAPGRPGPVDMPSGSVIVKSNFNPDPSRPGIPDTRDGPGAVTSMFNIEGYCPDGAGGPADCDGGDWFFLLRVGDQFLGLSKTGDCANCHAAAKNGDWLWRLFTARRFTGDPAAGGGN
jgi:hypothetical protein